MCKLRSASGILWMKLWGYRWGYFATSVNNTEKFSSIYGSCKDPSSATISYKSLKNGNKKFPNGTRTVLGFSVGLRCLAIVIARFQDLPVALVERRIDPSDDGLGGNLGVSTRLQNCTGYPP